MFVCSSEGRGRLRAMSIKTSLVMMSAGKFVDKLKCTLRCWSLASVCLLSSVLRYFLVFGSSISQTVDVDLFIRDGLTVREKFLSK